MAPSNLANFPELDIVSEDHIEFLIGVESPESEIPSYIKSIVLGKTPI